MDRLDGNDVFPCTTEAEKFWTTPGPPASDAVSPMTVIDMSKVTNFGQINGDVILGTSRGELVVLSQMDKMRRPFECFAPEFLTVTCDSGLKVHRGPSAELLKPEFVEADQANLKRFVVGRKEYLIGFAFKAKRWVLSHWVAEDGWDG